ncbi:helix-turn-helix domain-containing protein [Vibrio europaeus]|uniref:Helix-turn-helix transcriptional regulator n=1 Tax=Vibrio europaeus TaxID=300876 RepID=A0ABT5GMX8_9VIBR|nr:helix-turn-helix transcriptional regulator [Vibrio europaeus]MDC5723077.1 helix-turn-helix transcriptional regulator [Vibrio europaeus]MDC5728034.1 helix-turn-helix transcriptional regulator [Vibrio europaeus]MDC5733337.1 helix-turn-helix transcriptional regulator [Vibrio europaeus]MDC5738624.1 helix-turn-helix transcriptional regulator [Vibrio europaeus]MDC5743814.1 helix-turn-helix transcriptional regulator [Vibrio europaeus]
MGKISTTVAVLRRFRELSGKSREDMSKETGIGIRVIERFESGEVDMWVSDMEKYLVALNITHFDLAVAIQNGNYTLSKDMEAVSKSLPHDVRLIHLEYLIKLAQVLNKKGS